jgi:hypothetical protein
MEMFAVDPKQRPSAVKIVQAPCLKKCDTQREAVWVQTELKSTLRAGSIGS